MSFHDVAVTLLAKAPFTLSSIILSPPEETDDPGLPCLPTHIAFTA